MMHNIGCILFGGSGQGLPEDMQVENELDRRDGRSNSFHCVQILLL